VADLSMGSGHFLVNAVDRIEARLTSFLTEHPLPSVNIELDNLRKVALERLGNGAAGFEGIEQAALVRRRLRVAASTESTSTASRSSWRGSRSGSTPSSPASR